MTQRAFVYMLRCADGTLYTGWTTDVARRWQEHQAGQAARYTRGRRPVQLVYQEEYLSEQAARRREAIIKRWPRAAKLKLIRKKS